MLELELLDVNDAAVEDEELLELELLLEELELELETDVNVPLVFEPHVELDDDVDGICSSLSRPFLRSHLDYNPDYPLRWLFPQPQFRIVHTLEHRYQ